MKNLTILFHSQSGNVHQLAEHAASTAEKMGADVRLRKISTFAHSRILDRAAFDRLSRRLEDVPECSFDDLTWANAVMIGTPVVFGLPSSEIVDFIARSGEVSIPGDLMNKVVSVFTSGAGLHAGQESTILAVQNALCHWGSIIVPNGSSVPELMTEHNGGLPYGTCSSSWHRERGVHSENFAAIEYQATRLLEVSAAYQKGLQGFTSSIKLLDRTTLAEEYGI